MSHENGEAGEDKSRMDRPRASRLLAELATIIVGVLIALGVDSWWEGWQEQRNEEIYLVQLVEDLSQTEAELAMVETHSMNSLDGVERLLRVFQSGTLVPNDSTLSWLSGVTNYWNPVPIMVVPEALVATGHIRLVDATLRTEIIRWISTRDFRLANLAALERSMGEVSRELRGHYGVPQRPLAEADSSFEFDRLPAGHNVSQIYDEERVYSLLADVYSYKRGMATTRRNMATDAQRLRSLIEEELGR